MGPLVLNADFLANLSAVFAVQIGTVHRNVRVNGKDIGLAMKEFDLLQLFASHPEQVFSRNQLLSKVVTGKKLRKCRHFP